MPESEVTILVRHNGHFRVHGPIKLIDVVGNDFAPTSDPTALCRCGLSLSKPYCDGSHTGRFDAPTRATDPAAIGAALAEGRALAPQPRPHGASEDPNRVTVVVRANGPYRVYGPAKLVDVDGNVFKIPPGDWYVLCRCGYSETKPFCDSTHKLIDFRPETRAPVRSASPSSRPSPPPH